MCVCERVIVILGFLGLLHQKVAQRVVLFVNGEYGGVWDLRVLGDYDPAHDTVLCLRMQPSLLNNLLLFAIQQKKRLESRWRVHFRLLYLKS